MLPLPFRFIPVALLLLGGCSQIQNPFVPLDEYRYASNRTDYPMPPQKPITSHNMYRATMKPYCVNGIEYCPIAVRPGEKFYGIASWYGPNFHGAQTSNGEYYNMYGHTAAHKTLPINTIVKVTNLANGKSTTVRINDRGPFVKDRIIDLSYQAAQEIGVIKHGTAKVELEVISFDENANKYAHKRALPPKPEPAETSSATLSSLPSKSATAATPPQKRFDIQIASFSDEAKALAFKRKCYNIVQKHPIEIKRKKIADQPIYSIVISGFETIDEARDYMKRYGYRDAFVVRD